MKKNRKKLVYLDIKKEQILSFWEKGMSVVEIANKTYCTTYIVKKLLKQKLKGINLKQINAFKEISVSLDEKLQITREKHSSILLDIVLKNKELTRSEIKKNVRHRIHGCNSMIINGLRNNYPFPKQLKSLIKEIVWN